MPKLNLRTATRIKGPWGDTLALKGPGFSWTNPAPAFNPADLSPAAWWSFRDPAHFTMVPTNKITHAADLSGNGRTLVSANTASGVLAHPDYYANAFGNGVNWCATGRYQGFSVPGFDIRYMAARMYRSGVSTLNRNSVSSIFDIVNSSPYSAASQPVSINGGALQTAGFLPRPDSTVEWYSATARTANRIGSLSSTGVLSLYWCEIICLAQIPTEAQRENIRAWLMR